MKERIKIDFRVETVSENGKEELLFKADKLFYKFIWCKSEGSKSQIGQFYFLRYELADNLSVFLNTDSKNDFLISSGEKINFSGTENQLEIILNIQYTDTIFQITGENAFIKTLLSDLNILAQNRKIYSPEVKERLLQNLLGKKFNKKNMDNVLSEKDLDILHFESNFEKKKFDSGLIDIYKVMLTKNLSDTSMLKYLLMANFDFVYNNERCDCTNQGCFFNLLKKNLLYFFNDNYLDEQGEIDQDKVENDFDKLWLTLPTVKKASLMFLCNEFENSTLLNLGFIRPDFDLSDYQFLMTYPYQPDSSEEEMVREVSTLSIFFIKLAD